MQNLNESEAIDVLAGKISEKIVIDRKDFDNAFLLVLRAMTSVTAGDMQAARRHLKALRKIIGNDPIIDVLTMKIYKGEKDFDKMEKLSAKLMKNEDIQIVGMKAAVEAQMENASSAKRCVPPTKLLNCVRICTGLLKAPLNCAPKLRIGTALCRFWMPAIKRSWCPKTVINA